MRLTNARPQLSALAFIAGAAFLAHLLTLTRYGFYRDELYFLACAKRLAWGFVDQPPLMPAFGAVANAFGGSLLVLRLPAALAALGTILLAAALAREFGARRFGSLLAALAVALMPGSLFLGNTLTTTSLEPFTWSAAMLCSLRLARAWDLRWFAGLIAACTLAAYGKYSIFLLLPALIAAACALRERRLALSLGCATVLSLLLLLPNIVWQAVHGFPILEVLANDVSGRHAFHAGPQYEFAGALANAPAFVIEQLLFAGLLCAPLWIAGLVRSRLLAVTYAILVAASIALSAKGYYIVGIYPVLIAAGSALAERWTLNVRRLLVAGVALGGIALAPLTLPVLPVNALIAYMHAFGAPDRLMQPLFADEFGWDALTRSVAAQYRPGMTLYADTYGDAAALDYYGPRYGLPPAISGQNQYYLWGTRGESLSRLLVTGASQYRILTTLYRNVHQVGSLRDPYRWVIEGPTPLYLCTQPRFGDAEIWRRLRWYGA